MPDKPWLGAQEAHYASLLWHLDVPDGYTSQVDATRSVFPGKAMVNVDAPPPGRAQVRIKGFAEAWITDMECATSFQPKMYGFDFGRVTEAFQDGANGKRLVVEKTQAERAALPGLTSERAMMKDLMLATMREGGEVCLSHHTLNPFLPKINNEVTGDQIGPMLSLRSDSALGASGNSAIAGKDLGAIDIVNDARPEVDAARQIIQHNANLLGRFLNEVLGSEHSAGKDIWLRLLHEPNIGYFWWGQPEGSDPSIYYVNFARLWNFTVSQIMSEIDAGLRSRVKLVFSINGEQQTGNLSAKLNKHFPAGVSPQADIRTFMQGLAVLGLDYYEDWARVATDSKLPAQYQAIVDKVAEMKRDHDLTWDHALTEVSVRSNAKGKLYGDFGNLLPWVAGVVEDETSVPNRTFFDRIVYELVKRHNPKWVLFWVNRVGNAILSSFEPVTNGPPNGQPNLFYNKKTNVFTNNYVEHYFPIFPAEPFAIETFRKADSSGTKHFFPISQTEQVPKLPGASAPDALEKHVKPYKSAITDFFKMVPDARRTANKIRFLEVEAFMKDPTGTRPMLTATPSPAEKVGLVFDVL